MRLWHMAYDAQGLELKQALEHSHSSELWSIPERFSLLINHLDMDMGCTSKKWLLMACCLTVYCVW